MILQERVAALLGLAIANGDLFVEGEEVVDIADAKDAAGEEP